MDSRSAAVVMAAFFACACGGISVTIPRPGTAGGEGREPGIRGVGPESLAARRGPTRQEGGPDRESASVAAALTQVRTGQKEYRIGPGDLIEITVYQEKDLAKRVRVGPDGRISFPLIGAVHVGGLDVPGAEAALTSALRKYLVDPQVAVFIAEYANKLVYVLGEVRSPGSVRLPSDATLTVLEAIVLAGGFTSYAALDRTRVIREVEGRSESIPIQVSDIMKGGDKSKDLALKPNDVIYVPESYF